ncbi:MAG: ATP-binding protein [Mogibacterium sp.]|nr:ATP-binding protein [Mogibacterium sp.]
MEQNTYNNPFTPSFGEIPHCFAGRDNIIREMETALDKDSRSPELTLLISGARGTGKTALLAKICDQASQKGWIAVKTVASQGMLEDIYQHVIKAARHLISDSSKERKLSGLGIGQLVNLEWQHAEQGDQNWRIRMEKVLDELDSKDVGILIAVDEVDVAEQEMIQLG